MTSVRELIDTALDRAVVPGYTNVGYWVRRRGWGADDPRPGSMRDKRVLVTGASSGLGEAAAEGLARLGATVHLLVRDQTKGRRVLDEIAADVPEADLHLEVCDVADLADVRRFADDFASRLDRLDVLVHNAGAMPPERTEAPGGHELTVALHVLGPLLMTELLLPVLRAHDARVVMVTSGGMYTQPLPVHDPDYERGEYRGTVAYARSKRMQVALAPLMEQRWSDAGVQVHVMHPGWADTPGVASSLPLFKKVVGPLLRDAHQGADTIVWLAATEPQPEGGRLWMDRAERPPHYRKGTRETAAEREQVWAWVLDAAGLDR